jgi:hypothetical protein
LLEYFSFGLAKLLLHILTRGNIMTNEFTGEDAFKILLDHHEDYVNEALYQKRNYQESIAMLKTEIAKLEAKNRQAMDDIVRLTKSSSLEAREDYKAQRTEEATCS